VLTFEMEDAILAELERRGNYAEAICVRVLVETGMREGELCSKLRPAQITFDVDAEGNENGWIGLEADQTKNDEPRLVYIRPDLARKLLALMQHGRVPKASRLLRLFKQAAKSCGAPRSIVIHSLRHTRNTRLRKAGVDMKIRMKMLGHKTTSASMRYDHVDVGDQLQAAKKVEVSRGGTGEKADVIPFPSRASA
jgi:integrase